jgi:hypothetical protein
MAAGYPVYCGHCGEDIVSGDAHIIISRVGADHHTLYCSACCPADHTQPGHLMAQFAIEDKAAGRKPQQKRKRKVAA